MVAPECAPAAQGAGWGSTPGPGRDNPGTPSAATATRPGPRPGEAAEAPRTVHPGHAASARARPGPASPDPHGAGIGPHPRSRSPVRRKSQTAFPIRVPAGPLTAACGKDAARQTADSLPLYRPDRLGRLVIYRIGKSPRRDRPGTGPLNYPDHLSGPDDMAGPHPQIVTFPQARSPDGRREEAMARLTARFSPGNWRRLQAESVTGEDNRADANARLTPG